MSNHTKNHLSVVPSPPEAKQPNYKLRRRVAAGVALVGLGAAAFGLHELTQPPKEAEPVACMITPETHPYTFKKGQGEDAAILAIKGSGNGEGDLCWNTAKAYVKTQLAIQDKYHQPNPPHDGEVIQIPYSVTPSTATHK